MKVQNSVFDGSFLQTNDELDLLKFEVDLLERRIEHLEGLQYRLRQFSTALWLAAVGVGLGITAEGRAIPLLLIMSALIPVMFIYLDAWYATVAQRFRSRRNEIAYCLNSGAYVTRSKRETEGADQTGCDPIFLLDLMGVNSLRHSKVVKFASSMTMKLTRRVRLCFYASQAIISSVLVSYWLVIETENPIYYLLILVFPLVVLMLVTIRNGKERTIRGQLPGPYKGRSLRFADREGCELEMPDPVAKRGHN